MLKGMMLVSYGGFSEMFASWERIGVFTYILPFLLIFALIFVILSRMKIFKENKGINVVIALAVSLIALQYPLVPQFFSVILPKITIGLIVILAVLILIGLFADPESNALNYGLLGVGGIILLVVLVQTGKDFQIPFLDWLRTNWAITLIVIVVLAFIIIIIASSPPKAKMKIPEYKPLLFREGG